MRPESEPRRVRARAWCRVDLGGGTLDIWPLGLLHAGACTVNVAIDTAVRVELRRIAAGYRLRQGSLEVREATLGGLRAHPQGALAATVADHLGLPPVEIFIDSDSPRGGGLGASSALAVALIAAGEKLVGRTPSGVAEMSALARDLEAVLMGLPTGRQDHYPALLGGALEIAHRPGQERVRRLEVDLERLASGLVVAYSGQSHFSAATNWQIIRRRLEGDAETVAALDGIAAAAAALPAALEAGELERAAELMTKEWAHRRRLAPEVSTPRIEALLREAASAGSWGGKATGAGGGGCVVLLCPPEARSRVRERLAEAGARIVATAPVSGGLELRAGAEESEESEAP